MDDFLTPDERETRQAVRALMRDFPPSSGGEGVDEKINDRPNLSADVKIVAGPSGMLKFGPFTLQIGRLVQR